MQQGGHEEVDTEAPGSKENGRDPIHMKPACKAITENTTALKG